MSFFTKLCEKSGSDRLTSYLRARSRSLESYVTLRKAFLSSYTTMSLCHWILGVGDRHPNNFLVNTDTGTLIGIDFGHVFGTATTVSDWPDLQSHVTQICYIVSTYSTGYQYLPI